MTAGLYKLDSRRYVSYDKRDIYGLTQRDIRCLKELLKGVVLVVNARATVKNNSRKQLLMKVIMLEIIKEIEITEKYLNVIENDVKKVNEDCNKINCSAVYQAIEDTIKLIIDCVACCFKFCKPKKE